MQTCYAFCRQVHYNVYKVYYRIPGLSSIAPGECKIHFKQCTSEDFCVYVMLEQPARLVLFCRVASQLCLLGILDCMAYGTMQS